jgi:hypothetical protein
MLEYNRCGFLKPFVARNKFVIAVGRWPFTDGCGIVYFCFGFHYSNKEQLSLHWKGSFFFWSVVSSSEDWSRKHLMKGEALSMNLKNLLEERVQQSFETVNTICVEWTVQMKNRIVYKINFGLPHCFSRRMLTIWRNKSAPKNYFICSHWVLIFLN